MDLNDGPIPALTPSGAKPVSRLGASRVDPGQGLYHSEGNAVFQDGKRIATCFTGHQGQAPDIIASRIAALLNKDFAQFCVDVAAYSQSTEDETQ